MEQIMVVSVDRIVGVYFFVLLITMSANLGTSSRTPVKSFSMDVIVPTSIDSQRAS